MVLLGVPVFRKPRNVGLHGFVERLAYAHLIFKSDICLGKRVVSMWGGVFWDSWLKINYSPIH